MRLTPAGAPQYACFLDAAPLVQGCWVAELRASPAMEVQLGSAPSLRLVREAPHRSRFRPGHPLVWVTDPVTGVHAPYWAPRAWAADLQHLVPGAPVGAVRPDLAAALVAVGALVDPADEHEDGSQARALHRGATHFGERAYADIADLVPRAHVAALRDYQERLVRSGRIPLGDAQCAGRFGVHDDPMARFFLHQLAPAVSQVVAEPVKPAYAYSISYTAGAELSEHTDRAQCEYTVSLLVGADSGKEPWPLWLRVGSERVSVLQRPGDALVFAGRRLPHWRERLPEGRSSASLLLHYVPVGFSGSLR